MHPALERAWGSIEKGNYRAAVDVLRAGGRDLPVLNALGVCLLRLGQHAEALNVFRQFVLAPGTVSERADVPDACKRNFATSLLLSGRPSGAATVLLDIGTDHEMAAKIAGAMKRWEKSLSWLRWLDWKLNMIEPPQCHVPIDFEPGEFDLTTGKRGSTGPSPVSKTRR